jgi:hypothetical protein
MDPTPSALAKKLKLKPGTRAAVIDAPPGYLEQLAPQADVAVSETLDGGPFDWIQVFVGTSAELAAIVAPLTAAIARAVTSGSRTEGQLEDANGPHPRQGLEPLAGGDLMWLSLVSVDDTWSAFGLRPYKQVEARQAFR